MVHSRKLNNRIYETHQTALIIVYQVQNLKLDKLLAEDVSYNIYDPNSQKLIIEIFKVKINLGPKTVNKIFEIIEFPYSP